MFKRVCFVAVVVIFAVSAQAANVPKFMNYQGVLYDDGGNPLPDGPTNIILRILDAELNIVYEEEQEVEIVSGVASIMVGEGVNPSTGVPAGGINADILLPEGPKYLEIQAAGYPAESMMELVSVPYATYADIAYRVADGSIDSDQIKEGSVKAKHLSDDFLDEFTERISSDDGPGTIVVQKDFNEYKSYVSSNEGASQVGVRPGFSYSSATNLQNVLQDFDHAIKKRSEDAKKVDGSLIVHTSNASNPHGVTPEQIGAAKLSDLDNYISSSGGSIDGDLSTEGKIIINEELGAETPEEGGLYKDNIIFAWGYASAQPDGYMLEDGFNVTVTNTLYRCKTNDNDLFGPIYASPDTNRCAPGPISGDCLSWDPADTGHGRLCVLFKKPAKNRNYAVLITQDDYDASYQNESVWGRDENGFGIYFDNDGGGGVHMPANFMIVGGY